MDSHNLSSLFFCNETFYNDSRYHSLCSDQTIQKMTYTLYGIIFVLGTIGNGLVIWIAGFRMKKTINATWFLNLAIADFLCCASLSLRIVHFVYPSSEKVVLIFCIFNVILFLLNMSASVLLLTAMSIDRCVSVMWPFWAKVHRTRKLVRITAAIIWMLSALWTVFVILWYKSDNFATWFHNVDVFMFNFDYQNLTIQLIRLFTMFVIPFLIILISYVIIFFKLRKSKRSQRSQRLYRIITTVILGFLICWGPYYIWPMTLMYGELTMGNNIVNIIVLNLAFFNSCINPIIYVFISQDIKHGFFRSIRSRLEGVLKDQPNDLCREEVHQA